MKISTKGRYGVRLMLELGLNYPKSIIPAKELAYRQEISEKYSEQIIGQLQKSGLVKSIRGSQGGYTLAYPPDKITMGQILAVLEGSMAPIPCLEHCDNSCPRANNCAALDFWSEINSAIKQIIDTRTLADIINLHNQKNNTVAI